MNIQEKPHYSRQALELGERVTRNMRHVPIVGQILRAANGSSSPAAVEADWYSREVTEARVQTTVTAYGDPNAGRFMRSWNLAAVIAVSDEELESLHEQSGRARYEEAVAYITAGVVHVGVNAGKGPVLGRLNDDEHAAAMRQGTGSLEATAGLWLPGHRVFLGAESVRLVDQGVNIDQLPHAYPGVPLDI